MIRLTNGSNSTRKMRQVKTSLVNLDRRIEEINQLLIDLAKGEYQRRGLITDERDDYDGIVAGINMLAEELETTTISRDYLNSIYKGIVDMVFVLDEHGNILEINESVHESLKFSKSELSFKSFNYLFPPEQRIAVGNLKSILAENGYWHNIEKEMITNSHHNINVSCSFSVLKDKRGEAKGILMVAKDISVLKKTEKELKVRNRELNTFIYRASHDLKGPLASMMGLIHLAEQEAGDPTSFPTYIDLIKDSITKLNVVIGELVDLGRITVNELHYKYINVEAIIQEIIENLQYIDGFNEVKINVENKYGKELNTEVKILKSILQNLIENSIKYRRQEINSFIKIVIEEAPGGIYITVKDNGVGIEEEIQPKVFDMFYRGTSLSQGTGLGLYIVKSGVEKLNGAIKLRSKLDTGTFIKFYLPNGRLN